LKLPDAGLALVPFPFLLYARTQRAALHAPSCTATLA